MRRRDILKAAPSALMASAVPAVATLAGVAPAVAVAETPVMALFREWECLNAAVQAADAAGDDEAFERAIDDRWALEQVLIHEPSQRDQDVLLKIAAWTAGGETDLECENSHLSTVWSEVRALIGGAA